MTFLGRKRKPRLAGKAGESVTVIAKGTRMQGEVTTQGPVQLDGVIEGNIETVNALVIGAGGSLNGTVRAREVRVSGRIEGEIMCERLEIEDGGRVHGEVLSRSLVIAPGGTFRGPSRELDGTTTPLHERREGAVPEPTAVDDEADTAPQPEPAAITEPAMEPAVDSAEDADEPEPEPDRDDDAEAWSAATAPAGLNEPRHDEAVAETRESTEFDEVDEPALTRESTEFDEVDEPAFDAQGELADEDLSTPEPALDEVDMARDEATDATMDVEPLEPDFDRKLAANDNKRSVVWRR